MGVGPIRFFSAFSVAVAPVVIRPPGGQQAILPRQLPAPLHICRAVFGVAHFNALQPFPHQGGHKIVIAVLARVGQHRHPAGL